MAGKVETRADRLCYWPGARLDDDGTLYFTDVLAGSLHQLSPNGRVEPDSAARIDMAAGLVVRQRGTVICSDQGLTPGCASGQRQHAAQPDRPRSRRPRRQRYPKLTRTAASGAG